MPLIVCPDCGREVSDAAPACPNCGRPFQAAPQAPQAPPPPGRGRTPKLLCPECGGEHISKGKRDGWAILTCLTCGHMWAPGLERATAQMADQPRRKSLVPLLLLFLIGAFFLAGLVAYCRAH